MAVAAQITESCVFHGEGPFWDRRSGRLLFVDMLAGAVVVMETSGELTRHTVGTIAAVVRGRTRGGYVLAVERGFALAAEDFAIIEALPAVFDDPAIRMNEGGCDPQGRFYCGSMAYEATTGAGTLYRLDPDLSVHTVLPEVTISNGLQWGADGSTVYYNDTATERIDAFDFDGESGTFHNRRPFVQIDPSNGAPDGMAIDDEGGLWVALWGGGAVHRYDANRALTHVIELPVTNVTACAFGGAGESTLFITTSREGLRSGEEPGAGALFSAEVGVSGASPHLFAG